VTTPSPIPPASPGLTPDHLRELAEARARGAKIRRAITLAYFDLWSVGIFGGLTLLGSLLSFSWPGLLLGIAMVTVAIVEFRAVQNLKNLDPAAPKRLALNQLFFGLALFTYAAYTLLVGLRDPGQYSGMLASQMPPDLAGSSMVGSINDITKLILILLYGTLAVVAITVQGGTALFYLSRTKHLTHYLATTPDWILQAQRAGMPL
jgi:hypothetical protein